MSTFTLSFEKKEKIKRKKKDGFIYCIVYGLKVLVVKIHQLKSPCCKVNGSEAHHFVGFKSSDIDTVFLGSTTSSSRPCKIHFFL